MNGPSDSSGLGLIARRIRITGVVQGVGFRPFVYRLAAKHHLAGWVLNNERGVDIHVEGVPSQVRAFVQGLTQAPPPAAAIAQLQVEPVDPECSPGFEIRHSRRETRPTVRISPDLAVCEDCLQEMQDPSDRRFGYPYINCTNCGPRFSIILRLPYDRDNTTMAHWQLCPQCQEEYEDPLNRRFHAQPTACPDCGPSYFLLENGQRSDSNGAALQRAVELLRHGAILAVKGIGGYHLACDARNRKAVHRLRERKFRKEKPFAIIVRSLPQAHRLVQLSPGEEKLLLSVARPIVLARAKEQLAGVAPGNPDLGIMLPYAPLHTLLFEAGAPAPLVLTSANRSSEPIAYRDEDALARLEGLADAFLVGERPIARRIDDSVVADRLGAPMMIRRARGYAPATVANLPVEEPILALGADLKNAVALSVNGEVFLSQYIGQLGVAECNGAFSRTIDDLLEMYAIERERLTVASDSHPEFYSSRAAATLTCRRRVSVQHHRAHIASVLAEQQAWDTDVVGLAYDGTGYGDDGAIWGGEVFLGCLARGLCRQRHLRPAVLPGGDAAARFPVQAAAGFLSQLNPPPDLTQPPFEFPRRYLHALELAAKRVRTFPTTSMGRLFDCVAALCGFKHEVTFEGQAAIWLEHQARTATAQPYPFPDLDYRPLLEVLIQDRQRGREVGQVARAFHEAVVSTSVDTVVRLGREQGLKTAVLSGGVFQNRLLLEGIAGQLKSQGWTVWTNRSVPVNDGGIGLGQAAIAAFTLR